MQYFKQKQVFMKFFPAIKCFLTAGSAGKGDEKLVGSELKRFSKLRILAHWLLLAGGGCFAAAAFPPLNWSFAAFTSLTVLWLGVRNFSALQAALGGWVWGMGYAVCSFFWLREINPAIPWLMMLVLGVMYFTVDTRRTLLRIAFVFIVAGGIGNFIDRMYYQVWDPASASVLPNGAVGVRDMVDISRLGFAVCNFADFFISAGAVMLVLALLFFDGTAVWPVGKKYKALAEEERLKEEAKEAERQEKKQEKK